MLEPNGKKNNIRHRPMNKIGGGCLRKASPLHQDFYMVKCGHLILDTQQQTKNMHIIIMFEVDIACLQTKNVGPIHSKRT